MQFPNRTSLIKNINKSKEKPKNSEISFGSGHILLVDDEKMLTDMWGLLLEKLGYKVTCHNDSNIALTNFLKNPKQFDMIISDQTMPNMSGFELSKNILKIRANIPIILCTGFSSTLDTDKAMKLGIRKILSKPFDTKQLSETVRTILDGNSE